MAVSKVIDYTLYYTSIEIAGVVYPFVVAKVYTDIPVDTNTTGIQLTESLFFDIGEYCKTKPVIVAPSWGSNFNSFFNENIKYFVAGDSNGFQLSYQLDREVHGLLKYNGIPLLSFEGSHAGGQLSSKQSNAVIPFILVYGDTNTLITFPKYTTLDYHPYPSVFCEPIESSGDIPIIGFSFTQTGAAYCTTDVFTSFRANSTDLIAYYPELTDYAPPEPFEPFDPFKPGGDSEPGGGGGDFDDTSTPIDIPELPQLSASDTGFITLFNPSMSQLQELSSYMWSDLFNVDGWKKIFADPMDAILGLSIVPVSVPAGGARPVTVGNISTGVTLTTAASQYVSVDCGSINVKEYWGAYLDYDPYTKAEIYLPYIGTHAIAVDDIMGKTVHVVYHVDILSGACCAYVKCGESVLYSFVGQCSCSIPITGSDWTNVINGALSIAGAIGSMVATGGASAPMAIGTMASAAVNSLKPSIEKSGSMGGMGGMLGIQVPYLILTRPRQALPAHQNKYMGYPAFITVGLGECKGYTEIDTVHLEGIPATQEEISEIESLLKGGVIF